MKKIKKTLYKHFGKVASVLSLLFATNAISLTIFHLDFSGLNDPKGAEALIYTIATIMAIVSLILIRETFIDMLNKATNQEPNADNIINNFIMLLISSFIIAVSYALTATHPYAGTTVMTLASLFAIFNMIKLAYNAINISDKLLGYIYTNQKHQSKQLELTVQPGNKN